jgi:hypothetical protein
LSIGRAEDRDVVIADPAASRHHSQISLQTGEYVLRDMGSANGIFVNAVRVRECTLADGDLIRIGNTEMRFVRYHEGSADNTTQVVPGEQWQSHWEEPAPAKSGRGGLILGVLVIVLLLGGAAFVLFLIVVLIVLVFATQPGSRDVATFQAGPPPWALQIDAPSTASTDALAEEGTRRMGEGQRLEALRAFYQVLQREPAKYSYVDNFAFATGEGLVLEALQPHVAEAQAARAQQEMQRDRLLVQARKSGRPAADARRELERDHRNDPVVVAQMGWPATETMISQEKKAAEAKKLLADDRPDDALAALSEVLATSRDPKLRKQATALQVSSWKALTQSTSDPLRAAVMLDVTGDDEAARLALAAIVRDHPAHVSARLRLAAL